MLSEFAIMNNTQKELIFNPYLQEAKKEKMDYEDVLMFLENSIYRMISDLRPDDILYPEEIAMFKAYDFYKNNFKKED